MSAAAAIRRGFAIALGDGYQPLRLEVATSPSLVSPGGSRRPMSLKRLAGRGDEQAALHWAMTGTVMIEFRNREGFGGITLTDLFPAVATRMRDLAGEDFALHAARAFAEISPSGLPADSDERAGPVPLGGPDAEADLARAVAAMTACSVASTEMDIVEATQTLCWNDGLPAFSSWGTARDGTSVEAVPRGTMARVIAELKPVVTAKLRPKLPGVDSSGCPSYMIRDDLEQHPPLNSPEDVIRAVRAASKAAHFLGIPRGEPVFDVRCIDSEQ